MRDHEAIYPRLDDYLDGLLAPDERRRVEWHLAECESCQSELHAEQRLRAAVGELPREIAPPRDLWAAIADRIGEGGRAAEPATPAGAVIEVDFRRRTRRTVWSQRGVLAAASVALIVLSSSVTALLLRDRPGAPAATPGEAASGPVSSALVAFEPAEQEFLRTADELAAVLEVQRDRLRPETVSVVEENLRIIDRAIGESRAALEADPNNRDLTLMLAEVYRHKIDLLRNTVQIASL